MHIYFVIPTTNLEETSVNFCMAFSLQIVKRIKDARSERVLIGRSEQDAVIWIEQVENINHKNKKRLKEALTTYLEVVADSSEECDNIRCNLHAKEGPYGTLKQGDPIPFEYFEENKHRYRLTPPNDYKPRDWVGEFEKFKREQQSHSQ
jgi:hypothetical protein